MASLSYALSLLQGVPIAAQVLTIIAAIPIAIYAYDGVRKERLFPEYPLISLHGKTSKESWANFLKETLVKGAQLCPDSPFQIAGPKLILPQKYAEKESWKRLSVIEDLFGDQTRGGEWQTISIRGAAMQIVALNTLRIRVGEKLCRDPELIDIHTRHAGAVFAAGSEIRAFPTALWPIVHWFSPLPQQLRKQLNRADEVMGEEVPRREQEARTAIASGQKMAKFGDSVAWHVDVINSLGVKDYDQTAGQLAFTVAALHNTSTQLGRSNTAKELAEVPWGSRIANMGVM
ncbi:cytochrome P450 monooxygenase [Fusarium agapanthi]|uniref:Cytochrome P450 monooxygenase n=1 Tax=Fusarium agapanthi TaxID=1803897 RepID=A0A9P5EAG6_9HYPO|nr:cytochrome P450 monooxygenase [Fusarium agapanthi]